jgi:hypothetical protein
VMAIPHMTFWAGKLEKGQTMIYKTIHRKMRLSNTNPTKPMG